MDSAATQMRAIHQRAREATMREKRRVRLEHVQNANPGNFENQLGEIQPFLPTISITQTLTGFQILIPLNGIDPSRLYVFAMPDAILIETRIENMVSHAGAIDTEVKEHRVIRKLKLHDGIAEGLTSARLIGDSLEISCIKTPNDRDKTWSELVQLNTRSSLGCV